MAEQTPIEWVRQDDVITMSFGSLRDFARSLEAREDEENE